MHTIKELYDRYINAYRIEIREIHTMFGREMLKELDLLEDLTLEEFEHKLKDRRFKDRWGFIPKR